jgi:Concanavalin A-like lectin/glucanases superfamily
VAYGTAAQPDVFSLCITPSSGMVGGSVSGYQWVSGSSSILNDGSWHLLAMSLVWGSGSGNMYIDGTLMLSGSVASSAPANIGCFVIGQYPGTTSSCSTNTGFSSFKPGFQYMNSVAQVRGSTSTVCERV